MRIGIVGPFNPACISDYLEGYNVPSINGVATSVNTMVREFVNQGHQVIVFTTSSLSEKTEVLCGKNIVVYLIPSGMCPRLLGSHQLLMGSFFLPRRIAKVIESVIDSMDVLHAHWTYEYGKAASFLSNRITVFDTVRDWCPYQLKMQKKFVSRLNWMFKSILFKQVMSDGNITFIANSDYTYKMIKSVYPNKTVPVIPNPIDKGWILDKKKEQISNQFISIATSLMNPRKNIEILLKAFSMYRQINKDSKLHLVGKYDKNDEVFKRWSAIGLFEGVILHGPIPHDELSKLLDKMSCLVHPSLEETFGNILLEAMSRCIPCIGGEYSGAVPEVLGQGRYGLICNVENPQAIFEAMVEIGDSKKSLRVQRHATEMIKQLYSSDAVIKAHIDLYTTRIPLKGERER